MVCRQIYQVILQCYTEEFELLRLLTSASSVSDEPHNERDDERTEERPEEQIQPVDTDNASGNAVDVGNTDASRTEHKTEDEDNDEGANEPSPKVVVVVRAVNIDVHVAWCLSGQSAGASDIRTKTKSLRKRDSLNSRHLL